MPILLSILYWEHLFTEALPATIIYSLAGILLALFGFRLLDWLTPGDSNKKIFEEGNIAAAILGAALVLGICGIIVAAIAG